MVNNYIGITLQVFLCVGGWYGVVQHLLGHEFLMNDNRIGKVCLTVTKISKY